MDKILEGDLACFEVPDLLTFLGMGRRTGVLVLEKPDQETKVFFRDGQPIHSVSTRDDLRLPSLLGRYTRASAADLARLQPHLEHAASGSNVGELLISEGLLSEEELGPFLKRQVSEVIFDTFGWKSGSFTFFDEIPPPDAAIIIEIDLQNLIMEGVRRIDEHDRLEELFPDRELVVESFANPERVKHSATLTGEEWSIFFLVDGRRSIREICRLVDEPDDQVTLQVLHNLIVANLVVLAAPASPETSVASSAPGVPASPSESVPEVQAPPAQRPATVPPAVSPVVEFRAGEVARAKGKDTQHLVDPKAREYLQSSKRMAMARLVLRVEGQPERSFALSRDASTIGRHRNNDVVVSDAKVSSFHARIDRTPEGHELVDLGSRNGSFVNGTRHERVLLENNDEFVVGGACLRYLVDYSSAV
jgi:hypothetical protein